MNYVKVLSDERLGAKLRVTENSSSATTALSTLCQGRLYLHIYIFIYIYMHVYIGSSVLTTELKM